MTNTVDVAADVEFKRGTRSKRQVSSDRQYSTGAAGRDFDRAGIGNIGSDCAAAFQPATRHSYRVRCSSTRCGNRAIAKARDSTSLRVTQRYTYQTDINRFESATVGEVAWNSNCASADL